LGLDLNEAIEIAATDENRFKTYIIFFVIIKTKKLDVIFPEKYRIIIASGRGGGIIGPYLPEK